MNIPFYKMHGAGNDFILVDDRSVSFPLTDTEWLAGIARRRTGVGCDGIILIQPSDKADFRMRFFNPDGNEAEMCGNGARCVARLAHDIGAAPEEEMRIDTVAGVLRARIAQEAVILDMTVPTDWRCDRSLDVDGQDMAYSFVNTGVPHVVIDVETPDALKKTDVQGLGRRIRRHPDFAPAGANANFIAVTGKQALEQRTYERGVEAETLACGTGIVAGALVAARLGRVESPVDVTTVGNDVLTVGFRLTADSAEDVTLAGPTARVFEGMLEYPHPGS